MGEFNSNFEEKTFSNSALILIEYKNVPKFLINDSEIHY